VTITDGQDEDATQWAGLTAAMQILNA